MDNLGERTIRFDNRAMKRAIFFKKRARTFKRAKNRLKAYGVIISHILENAHYLACSKQNSTLSPNF